MPGVRRHHRVHRAAHPRRRAKVGTIETSLFCDRKQRGLSAFSRTSSRHAAPSSRPGMRIASPGGAHLAALDNTGTGRLLDDMLLSAREFAPETQPSTVAFAESGCRLQPARMAARKEDSRT